jgi:hypothetical protein
MGYRTDSREHTFGKNNVHLAEFPWAVVTALASTEGRTPGEGVEPWRLGISVTMAATGAAPCCRRAQQVDRAQSRMMLLPT